MPEKPSVEEAKKRREANCDGSMPQAARHSETAKFVRVEVAPACRTHEQDPELHKVFEEVYARYGGNNDDMIARADRATGAGAKWPTRLLARFCEEETMTTQEKSLSKLERARLIGRLLSLRDAQATHDGPERAKVVQDLLDVRERLGFANAAPSATSEDETNAPTAGGKEQVLVGDRVERRQDE